MVTGAMDLADQLMLGMQTDLPVWMAAVMKGSSESSVPKAA